MRPADKLEQQQELSARESSLLRRKLSALVAAGGSSLAELDQELTDVLDGGKSDDQQLLLRIESLQQKQRPRQQQQQQAQQRVSDLSSEGLLASALEDAESTIAQLQSRLVSASSAAATAEARVADLQQRLTAAAVRRTREVAAARSAGEVQLAALQDAVSRLGQRDDMTGQVGDPTVGTCWRVEPF